VKIYTVWVNQRVTDARDEIDVETVPGARHYWDDDWTTGRWVAEQNLGDLGYQGAVYDAYFLFGPDATWDDVPRPLLASGQPVVGATGLEEALEKLR
jgi:hypothetical protein